MIKQKPGGGNKLQDYSTYNGRYVETDMGDIIFDILLDRVYSSKSSGKKFVFPTSKLFSKDYCEIYITYVYNGNFEIPVEKMTKYLFVHKSTSDKSKWLRLHGYFLSNYKKFEKDLIRYTKKSKLEFDDFNNQGEMIFTQDIYIPESNLKGRVVWKLAKEQDNILFVTIKPIKGE